MAKEENILDQMEVAAAATTAIINVKSNFMKDKTRKNESGNKRNENLADENLKENISGPRPWNDRTGTSSLDEKSSGMGRRNKNTGLATKDGLTGSDYDGQVA